MKTVPQQYRSNVAMMVMNHRGYILMAQRKGQSQKHWQVPQGGIDPGEDIVTAARRELMEEVGTNHVEVISIYDQWLYYDVPTAQRPAYWAGQYGGQKQKWILFKFLGHDDDINIHTPHAEFSAWAWVNPGDILEKIIPFKADVYKQALQYFQKYIKENNQQHE